MATLVSPTVEKCKEKSFDSNDGEDERNSSCDSIGNVDKKTSYNERAALYKKPLKKNSYRLEADYTPQEIRRQRLLYYQKKLVQSQSCFAYLNITG